MKIEDLTPDQAEQFQACKTYEELMAHASEIGLEIEDDRAEMLRLSFEDPDAFAERMEQVIEADEDADLTEEGLKAIAGGAGDQSAYWPAICALCDPAAVRANVIKIYNKYNTW